MSTLAISEAPPGAEAERAVVLAGLRAFNNERMAADPDGGPLTLLLRDDDDSGAVRGGLLATVRWHWLLVHVMWVADEHRGHGHGRALLAQAEALALARGCRLAALDTTDFQARGFYERAGYTLFGEQADYPPGSRTFYLQEALVPAS